MSNVIPGTPRGHGTVRRDGKNRVVFHGEAKSNSEHQCGLTAQKNSPSEEGVETELLKREKDYLGWRKECIQMPEKDRNVKSTTHQSKASVAGIKKHEVASSQVLGVRTSIQGFWENNSVY